MAGYIKKTVLIIQEQYKFPEKFKNREKATKLAKDYGAWND
jgi:hypothetical protein